MSIIILTSMPILTILTILPILPILIILNMMTILTILNMMTILTILYILSLLNILTSLTILTKLPILTKTIVTRVVFVSMTQPPLVTLVFMPALAIIPIHILHTVPLLLHTVPLLHTVTHHTLHLKHHQPILLWTTIYPLILLILTWHMVVHKLSLS